MSLTSLTLSRPIQDLGIIEESTKTPVWHNGRLVAWEDALIHIGTHAVNFGSAVFEEMRFYETVDGPALFRLDAHLERLAESLLALEMELPSSMDELRQACIDVAKDSQVAAGGLRVQVQFGLSELSLHATSVVDATVMFRPLREDGGVRELSLATSGIERLSPHAAHIEALVTGHYANAYYNHLWARKRGLDEAVMLDVHGNVAETSAANLFYVKDKHLFTPEAGCLVKGVTRDSVLRLAADVDIPTGETTVSVEDLQDADEIFLTATFTEIEPVVHYDERPVGDGHTGPVTRRIADLYRRAVTGKLPAYGRWLTSLEPSATLGGLRS
ncbi:MAG TPA: aminotransferase class IV [Thermoguttaceae bacterium]|nr:aminotransferase class IV [Thermoguttaceae bacterium]